MAYTDVWDVTTPLDTQQANQGAVDFRMTKLDIMQRVASFGAGVLAARPTPETTSGSADWTGVMYWATDTAQVFRWSGTAWVDISSNIPSSVVNSFFTAGILQIAHGGTGTATPGLVAGAGISLSGAWPNTTIVNLDDAFFTGGILQPAHGGTGNSSGAVSPTAAVDLVGQTAAIGSTLLFAVPASPASGTNFIFQWNAKITTAAGVSSTLGPLTLSFTDPDGTAFSPAVSYLIEPSGAAINRAGATGNATNNWLGGLAMLINCKASTHINYTFGYASNPAGVMAYDLHMRLIQV